MMFGGVKLAYNVKFDKKVISTVSNKEVYYAAVDIVADIVEGEDVVSHLPEAEINTVVTINDTVDSCDIVADAIIDNTDEIVSASRLIVGGNSLGCANTEDLNTSLENRKNCYNIVGFDCESEFCDDVIIEEGFFLKSELGDISELSESIAALNVKTTVKETCEQYIPYKTVTNKTDDKPAGYVGTEQAGEYGISVVTSGIVYINGVENGRVTLSSEVTKEPVDEIITVGTTRPEKGKVVSKGFLFPLPSGVWEVSCPYGKGGHGGVDLRAPQGTTVMAVASGTVTLAGVYRDYGNCVIVDHGNGISTLYAHASRLCVKEGDTVTAGEVIALVGSTGNSTGNHLHFEVYVGDNRVNPQPYIGLK
ncbi:MAG: peptidoglycan DD-metalloendopeptidase family protein [Clostridia bacterium]|nr:peptidoglycan DD-metalloendopeptidase family protein [Clostridia bacterium]